MKKYTSFINLGKATVCCLGFLGLYNALYSAQNIQSLIFDDDGYGKLGFYSNAVSYVGQATGSVLCMNLIAKLGDRRCMAYGSLLCVPFIISLILPALKSEYQDSENFFFSNGFVYFSILLCSLANGTG